MTPSAANFSAPPRGSRRESGVVLMVVLILLLLTTIVSFQVMETSTMQARMAAAREAKEVSFQAAESLIDQSKNNQDALIQAFVAELSSSAWPSLSYTFTQDTDMGGTVEYRYLAEIAALGNDIVIGNPGLRSLHFELRSSTGRADDRFDSLHIQGIKRFAPRL